MGKKTSKTKSTSTPWQPAQPILLGAGQGITDTVNNNAANLNSVETGITGGTIPGIQSQIGDQKEQLQPGFNYINDTLGGKYLNSNPYMDSIVHQGEQDAGNAVNSTFSLAGRTGGGNHATELARGVAQAGNQIRYGDYQNERGLQNQALGQLPGFSTSQFAGYSPLLGAQQLAGQLPYYGANALGGIGGLYGGYGQQTGTQPGGWLNGLLGAGASLGSAAIMASDRKLKTNIRKVGEAKDGLGKYEWNWRSDPKGAVVRGVIADEVKELRPWAFVPNYQGRGFDAVNYGALGSLA